MFVATVTLDREAKLNALGPPMISDLERSLDQIDRDPEVRVVIVTAAGERAFCVGADVNAWSALEPPSSVAVVCSRSSEMSGQFAG